MCLKLVLGAAHLPLCKFKIGFELEGEGKGGENGRLRGSWASFRADRKKR
jgi:hypothetical protein